CALPISRGQTTTATQKRSSAPGLSASSAAPAAQPGASHKVTNHSGGRASLYMRVAAPLQQGNATVTLAFPGIRRVEFAPGGKELILLAADLQTVLIPHIKINARHSTSTIIFRLGTPQFEVHFKITLAVHARLTLEHAKAIVGTVTVQLAHRRHQVVQVGFHAP